MMVITRTTYERLPRVNRAVVLLMREEGLLKFTDDEMDAKQRGFKQ